MKGIKHLGEGEWRTELMRRQMSNKPGFASGGRVHSYPKITAGDNGVGRLQKAKAYGKNAKP